MFNLYKLTIAYVKKVMKNYVEMLNLLICIQYETKKIMRVNNRQNSIFVKKA